MVISTLMKLKTMCAKNRKLSPILSFTFFVQIVSVGSQILPAFDFEEFKNINYDVEILKKPVRLESKVNGYEAQTPYVSSIDPPLESSFHDQVHISYVSKEKAIQSELVNEKVPRASQDKHPKESHRRTEEDTKNHEKVILKNQYGQAYQCIYLSHKLTGAKEEVEEKQAWALGISQLLQPMKEASCLIHSHGWWTYEVCYGNVVKQYHLEGQKVVGNIVVLGYFESELDWNQTGANSPNLVNRYHSHQYVNGTVCDLTGEFRSAEVRFECLSNHDDFISSIREPQTCKYIITVSTSRICQHPLLKPKKQKQVLPMQCNPLLTAEEYEEYEKEEEEEKQKVLAEKERLDSEEAKNRLAKLAKQMEGSSSGDDVHIDEGTHQQENKLSGTVELLGPKSPLNQPDLQKMLTNFVADTAMKIKKLSIKDKKDDSKNTPQAELKEMSLTEFTENLNVEEKELYDYFDKELHEILNKKYASSSKLKLAENIEHAMSSKFQDIIDEAHQELNIQDTEESRAASMKALKSTIKELTRRLDDMQQELDVADEELDEDIKADIAKSMSEMFEDGRMPQDPDEQPPPDSSAPEADQPSPTNGNDLAEADKSEVEKSELKDGTATATGNTDDGDHDRDYKVMSPSSSFKINGQKVQLSIITADGTFKNVKDLPANQAQQIGTMVIAYLVGNADVEASEERQQTLEDNYKYVFKSKRKKDEGM